LEEELGFAAFKFEASFPNEHPMRYVIARIMEATGDGLGSVNGPSSFYRFGNHGYSDRFSNVSRGIPN
jgi:hypothetical protein